MTSLPTVFDDAIARGNRAAAKLVKKPSANLRTSPSAYSLYDALRQKEIDIAFIAEYDKAPNAQARQLLVSGYLGFSGVRSNRSEFLPHAIPTLITETNRVERRKPLSPVKMAIATIKRQYPNAPAKLICAKLDEMDIPVLNGWHTVHNRTWSHAYLDPRFTNRIKTYISKVKCY